MLSMLAILRLFATFVANLFKSRRRLEADRLLTFVIIEHGRRQLLWFAVTRTSDRGWLAQ